jgi:hypothetical protein
LIAVILVSPRPPLYKGVATVALVEGLSIAPNDSHLDVARRGLVSCRRAVEDTLTASSIKVISLHIGGVAINAVGTRFFAILHDAGPCGSGSKTENEGGKNEG